MHRAAGVPGVRLRACLARLSWRCAQLQQLFARLQLSDRGAVPTGALTRSFGWLHAEAFQQQDVQARGCPGRTGAALRLTPSLSQECMAVLFQAISDRCVGSKVSQVIDHDFSVRRTLAPSRSHPAPPLLLTPLHDDRARHGRMCGVWCAERSASAQRRSESWLWACRAKARWTTRCSRACGARQRASGAADGAGGGGGAQHAGAGGHGWRQLRGV